MRTHLTSVLRLRMEEGMCKKSSHKECLRLHMEGGMCEKSRHKECLHFMYNYVRT